MRSVPRWESRCSRRLPWRQAAGSRPAIGTASWSPRRSPPGLPSLPRWRSQGHANISAVAAQAGVSRVTVYAHFPTWAAILEAAVERAVRRTMAALQAVHPEDGPPVAALDRMLAATWQHLARHAAVAELLSPEAVTRTHQAAHQTI